MHGEPTSSITDNPSRDAPQSRDEEPSRCLRDRPAARRAQREDLEALRRLEVRPLPRFDAAEPRLEQADLTSHERELRPKMDQLRGELGASRSFEEPVDDLEHHNPRNRERREQPRLSGVAP